MATGTARARGPDAAGNTAEHRLDDGAGARVQLLAGVVRPSLVQHTHHLVAGNEGEANHVLEVPRAAPVQGGEVRSADSREQRAEWEPLVGWEVRVHGVEQLEWSDAGAPA